MKLTSSFIGFCFLCFSLVSLPTLAQNMKRLGTLDVHYIALSSTFITPEIAKAYNIERSRFNGLINISVLDSQVKGNPAKEVSISGIAQNNVGQIKQLEFREIKEGQAIYYLAELNFRNEESYKFSIDITDGTQSHVLKFSQTFYVE